MSSHSLSLRARALALAGSVFVVAGGVVLDSTAGAVSSKAATQREHVVAPQNGAPAHAFVDPNLPPDDEASGVVRKGYALGRADGPCPNLLESKNADGSSQCTHGPDAAPKGVDVRKPRTVEEIAQATKSTSTMAGTTGATVPCYTDGVSGNRVQAVYARASDKPDRFSSISALIPQWAANADNVFNNSAAKTGGIRHVRWVTDASCNLDIVRVTLTPTGDDNMSNTELELQSLGLDRPDRKYMIWMDANVYCGVGDIRNDDRPGVENDNNWGRMWARVDSGCWGLADSPEAHEIMHMMGGVQVSAPHSSGAWHCTDERDRMCYQDGPVALTYPCASSEELLFDCGNDDYFHTSPSPTSYLGTHWNSAMNIFLETTGPAPSPTTTTTTVPASSTTTSNWNGVLKASALSKTYSTASGSGTMVASSSYTGGGSTVTLVVKTSAGTVVGQTSGPTGVSLSVPVSSGNYTVTISGSKNTSYTLSVKRPT